MSKLVAGLVDYGVGNLASVRHSLLQNGLNCHISSESAVLGRCDLLVLPGVGAFRPAMEALQANALDRFLAEQAEKRKPILGICLGMQLLTEGSHEGGFTKGLSLIPGEVVPLGERCWHIGWNSLAALTPDPTFQHEPEETFYFNHAYCYEGPREYQVSEVCFERCFAAIIRRGRIVGMQFHPEKSQAAGYRLLKRVIDDLCDA